MKLTRALNFGGRIYPEGEDIAGKIPLDMIEVLRASGGIEEQAAEQQVDANALDPSVVDEAISLEEFKALSAAQQKEYLQQIEIDPASREEDRVEQYQAWLEEPEKEDSLVVTDDL